MTYNEEKARSILLRRRSVRFTRRERKEENAEGREGKVAKPVEGIGAADESEAAEMKIPTSSPVKRGQPSVRKEITAKSFNR